MKCPSPIAELLLDICQTGLRRIRGAGWSKDPGQCALEADHIHNLPDLLQDYSPERLAYYWDVERPAFLSQASGANVNVAEFDPLWQRLRSCMERLPQPVSMQ